jgi:hypothetical protein
LLETHGRLLSRVFGKITDEDQCCLENDEIRLMRTKNNAEINGIIAKKTPMAK